MRRAGAPWQFRKSDLFLIVTLAAAGVVMSLFVAGRLGRFNNAANQSSASGQITADADGETAAANDGQTTQARSTSIDGQTSTKTSDTGNTTSDEQTLDETSDMGNTSSGGQPLAGATGGENISDGGQSTDQAVQAAGSAQTSQSVNQVVITADGSAYGSWPISEDTTIDITTAEGTNQVIIQDGTVWMQQASCKNQICVETGKISRPGQLIVCLPNRVVVEIQAQNTGTGASTDDEGFDAVVR